MTERQVPVTDAQKAALGEYCGIDPARIVAVHEGVMVHGPFRSVYDPATDTHVPDRGPDYPTVEVVYTRRRGTITAERHRFPTLTAFLAAIRNHQNAA